MELLISVLGLEGQWCSFEIPGRILNSLKLKLLLQDLL